MVQVKSKNVDNFRIIRSFGGHLFLFQPLLYFSYSLLYFSYSVFSFYFKLIETSFSPFNFTCFRLRTHFSLAKIPLAMENTFTLPAYQSIFFKGHLVNKDVHFQRGPLILLSAEGTGLCVGIELAGMTVDCVGVWWISHTAYPDQVQQQ